MNLWFKCLMVTVPNSEVIGWVFAYLSRELAIDDIYYYAVITIANDDNNDFPSNCF